MAQQNTPTSTESSITPMNIVQAMVGLGFDDTDSSTLRYFNFFVSQIPTTASYFLHVLPKLDLIKALYEKEVEVSSGQYALDEEIIQRIEDRVKTGFPQEENIYVEYDVKEGDPLEELLKSAEQLKIDLLVIGQSKANNKHKILAKNLARETQNKALIIPQDSPAKISHILIPVDFSENSARALKNAVSFHKQLNASVKITCLYIYRAPSVRYFKSDSVRALSQQSIEANIMDGFKAFLHSNAPEYQEKINIALVEKTQPGISHFIMNYASENGCDFLFLGAKGHSNVHRLLMGSVAEEILDTNNSIPTMIIK